MGTNCAIQCGTRAYMLRGFLWMLSARKWCPKFPKRLILEAQHSIRSCLLVFYFSIIVVSCSSLSEVRQCRIWVCSALSLDIYRWPSCVPMDTSFTFTWAVHYIYIYIYLVDKVPQDITSTVPNIYAHMHKLDKKDN